MHVESMNGDALPLDLEPDPDSDLRMEHKSNGQWQRLHFEKWCAYASCNKPLRPGSRYCNTHHGLYMRTGHPGGAFVKTSEDLREAAHKHGDLLSAASLHALGEAAVEFGAARARTPSAARAAMRAALGPALIGLPDEIHDLDAAALNYTDCPAEATDEEFAETAASLERSALALFVYLRALTPRPVYPLTVVSGESANDSLHVGPPPPVCIREAA